MKHVFFSLAFLLLSFASFSQQLELNYGRFTDVPFTQGTDTFDLGTAGGLNSPEFSHLDLNMDGVLDLFVFERTTGRVKTFLNVGSATQPEFQYVPEYESQFPKLSDMAILRDYNKDGRHDIFTYNSPGIRVWKNVSDTNGLAWEKVDYFEHTGVGIVDYITADFFGNYHSNAYLLPGDLPGIEDIDGDGDLDLVQFGVWGVTVDYYKNMSIEQTGGVDSLTFRFETACWGEFIENSTSNSVSFGYTCKGGKSKPANNGGSRHAGSNLLPIDLDGDNDKDLILADIGYNNMIALTNKGDTSYAIMDSTKVDLNFPSNTKPVDLFIFPGAYYLDVDGDNVNELLAAPHTVIDGVNVKNVWLYENDGTSENPTFVFKQDDFMVGEMVDVGTGNNPAFVDLNADGFMDLVMGNYGYWDSSGTFSGQLAYFENKQDSSFPQFELISTDFLGLSAEGKQGLYPTFGDLNNDGNPDMILGFYDGRLQFYQNNGQGASPQFSKLPLPGLDSIDVGQFSAPQLVDLNGDQLLDLVIGERNGTLTFFPNTGNNTTPRFFPSQSIENFGGVSHKGAIGTGYTSPFAIKLDTAGRSEGVNGTAKWNLFVATEDGFVYVYDSLENNLNGTFRLFDTLFVNAYRPSISMAELNFDSIADIAIGEFPGGLGFYLK